MKTHSLTSQNVHTIQIVLFVIMSKSVGLKKEGAMNQARWRVGVGEIAVRVG